jgi:hypothetical protein
MAANPSPRIEFWLAIPRGSKMTISVAGTTPQHIVTATVIELREDGQRKSFPDSSVQPGPLSLTFAGRHSYSIETDLVFGNAGSATVTADVTDPNGQPIAPHFFSTIPGTAGQMVPVRFFVSTV